MKRSGPPKRRTQMPRGDLAKNRAWQQRAKPIQPTSKKRKAENRERRKILHATYGDNPACWACPILRAAGIDTGCDGRATDGHELLRAGQGGSRLDPTNVRPVGRPCHDWITAHPLEARALGLELLRATPIDQPQGASMPDVVRGAVQRGRKL